MNIKAHLTKAHITFCGTGTIHYIQNWINQEDWLLLIHLNIQFNFIIRKTLPSKLFPGMYFTFYQIKFNCYAKKKYFIGLLKYYSESFLKF
jgi:hypothetical protein